MFWMDSFSWLYHYHKLQPWRIDLSQSVMENRCGCIREFPPGCSACGRNVGRDKRAFHKEEILFGSIFGKIVRIARNYTLWVVE